MEKEMNYSEEEKKNILLKMGIPYFAQAGLALIMAVIELVRKSTLLGVVFIAFTVIFCVLGLEYYMAPEDKKQNYLTSAFIKSKIKEVQAQGRQLTQDEIDSIRFANDPVFHDEVVSRIHKEKDALYRDTVDRARRRVTELRDRRETRVREIADSRWERYDSDLSFNRAEGKAELFNTVVSFSDIKGATINEISVRKLFKMVCRHLGVVVDLNGFTREIILINKEVDHTDAEYETASRRAQGLVDMLHNLSVYPVPERVIPPEEEPEILQLDEMIDEAEIKAEEAAANTPDYSIPDRYLKDVQLDIR